jgi:hypothetical protein
MKLVEPKLFLRTFWWSILLYGMLVVILSDGYMGLKQGFDWSFIGEPRSYFKLIFSSIYWTAFSYFILWRKNPDFRKKKAKKFEKHPLFFKQK